ncbi:uncharacterized protein LOC121382890 [Gigantopelta aegis]|uniref:uncharacterized protein LOC121382890 n=1 Tax=Gigantopelta aegis TaxID=1735272 RepID=UPI001B8894F7|nr:uncharacterized protein LOC121382890 [Gigantopelta aegis]XP_041368504.1 uncharacterized protein LOC121382890 [Gigantopelta aegis]XP_041368505.1 uncharacterized protein LOC121382890 [Gigantopelta aegis]
MYDPLSAGRGRLPNIQAIGKWESVDEDDPPYVPVQVYGYEADGDRSSEMEPSFDVSDAEDAVKLLRKTFQIVNPGRHACRKNPEHGGSYFVHSHTSATLGKDYSQLRKVLEHHAKLEFVRDCLFRIRSASAYVTDLESVLNQEYRTSHSIQHGCTPDVGVSKLFCLNALCEDLRVHVNHWNVLKQRMNTSKWLQPCLGRLCLQVEHVKRTLAHLCDKAIWLLEHLINVGFEVFAHCDIEKLSPEVMWNVTRGLEDFNSIVSGVRTTNIHSEISFTPGVFLCVNPSSLTFHPCHHLHPAFANYPGRLGDSVKAIPFPKVLRILAHERSRYAAQLTHQFFTTSDELQTILNSGRLPPYQWCDRETTLLSSVGNVQQETSDYHTGSGRASRLSTVSTSLLRVGPIIAPDLSVYMSPLVEFSEKEQVFAENFLLIVCSSTTLLRKNDNGKARSKSKEVKVPQSPVIGRPPKAVSDAPVLSRADSRRKTVSWGDNADTSIRNQVVSRYMDVMWQQFGENLDLFMLEPAWDTNHNLLHSRFGSVLLCNDTVVSVIRHMIEYVCVKDLFPPPSVEPLLGMTLRLHTMSAFAAWDYYLSSAASSSVSDKCYPCPLVNRKYCTRTGILLRDSFRPLTNLAEEVWRSLGIVLPGSRLQDCDLLPRQPVDLRLAADICLRLLVSSRAAHTWCIKKTQQLLSAWAVGAFLLLTHTDLHLLVDETKRSTIQLQQLVSKSAAVGLTMPSDQLYLSQITQMYQHIGNINFELQGRSGVSMKLFSEKCGQIAFNFLRENMPLGKGWKRKTPLDFPTKANAYVEEVLESVLEPVIEGVSKLNFPSQLGVISMATVSLCQAWTDVILKEKIKFSYFGAHQLSVDFCYVKTWLCQHVKNADIRQSVLDLGVFKFLRGVVIILKKQPNKRPTSRVRDCSDDDISCECNSTDLTSISKIQCDHGSSLDGDEKDICNVNNVEDWMALRVVGGSRSWRFPSCFSGRNEVE